MLLAYIWNEYHKLPSEIYNLPPGEKEFIYQATLIRVKEEEKQAKKLKKK